MMVNRSMVNGKRATVHFGRILVKKWFTPRQDEERRAAVPDAGKFL